jgi:hypothetical protein
MQRAIALAPAVIVIAALGACHRRPSIASCDDDLRGVYTGPEPGERWMVLDAGPTLEIYALFPDSDVAGDVVAAPRVIDLVRAPADARGPGAPQASPPASAGDDGLTGTLHRRYMRRADSCDAQLPVRVTRCSGDALELVLADPSPPLAFAPCAWAQPGASRVVRWRRD